MKKNSGIKYFIVAAGIIGGVMGIIYGAIMPILKAQSYVDATVAMAKVRTIQDFEDQFNNAYAISSPIGGEEISKFLVSSISGMISNQADMPENVTRALAEYVEPKIFPGNPRHLIPMATIYSMLWVRFHHEEDYQKAVDYYQRTLVTGPKLPPALYSLFSLYQAHGDRAGMKTIGEQILTYWPQDVRISVILDKLGTK